MVKVLKTFEHEGKRYEVGDDVSAELIRKSPVAEKFLVRKGCIEKLPAKRTPSTLFKK